MYDIKKIRSDFPMLNGVKMNDHDLVYLDNGATALKPQCVIDRVSEYYLQHSTNAHRGDYELSHRTDSEFENVRKIIQKFLNASSEKEIAYTYGTTHGINIIASGIKDQLKAGDVILIDKFEHASNILPWFRLVEEIGVVVEYVELDNNYNLTVENFKKSMHDKVKIVALAHIGNVLGQKLEMKEITKIAHEQGAIVVVDGAQSVPHIAVDVQDLDIDFLVFSAHKLGGPTGIGALYGKYELLNALKPYSLGGGMNVEINCDHSYRLKEAPFKFEAGTPAIEATLGMGAAIEYIMSIGMDNIHQHICEIRKYAIDRIKNEVEGIIIYNEDSPSGPITFNVVGYEGAQAQDVGSALAVKGIAVRTGEHCARLLSGVINTKGSVRASLYFYNSIEDMDRLVEALKDITKGDVFEWLI